MDYGSSGLNLGNSSSSSSSGSSSGATYYNITDNSDATWATIDLNENVGIGKNPSGYKLDVNGSINSSNYYKNGVELPTMQGITSTASQSNVIELSNTKVDLNTQLKINRSSTDGDLSPPIYIVSQATTTNTASQVEGLKMTLIRPDETSYAPYYGPSIAFCNQNLNGTENRMCYIAGVNTDSSDIRSGGLWINTNKAGSGTRRMTLNHDGRLCLGVNVINPILTESMMEINTSTLQGWSSSGRISFVHSKIILSNSSATNNCDINYNQSLSRLEVSRPLYVSGDIFMNTTNKVATEAYVNSAITTGGSAQANQILPSGYTFSKDVNSELHLDSTETNEKINFDLPVLINNTLTSSSTAITTLNGDTNINKAKLITIDNNSSNGILEFKSADGAKKVQFIYDSVNNVININSNPTIGSSLIKTDFFRCNDYQFINYTNAPTTSSSIPNLKVSNNTLYFQNSTGVQIMATKSYVDSLAGQSSNLSLSAISITPSNTTQMIKLSVNTASNAQSGYGISQGFYIDDPNITETQVGKIEITKSNNTAGNTLSEMGLFAHDGNDLKKVLNINPTQITGSISSNFKVENATTTGRYIQMGLDGADAVYLDFGSKDSSTTSDYDSRLISIGGTQNTTGQALFKYISGSHEFYSGSDSNLVLKMNTADITTYDHILPAVDNSLDIGSSSKRFNEVYSESAVLSSIKADNTGSITNALTFNGSMMEVNRAVIPTLSNLFNIGNANKKWNDIYSTNTHAYQFRFINTNENAVVVNKIYNDNASDNLIIEKNSNTTPKQAIIISSSTMSIDNNVEIKSPANTEYLFSIFGKNNYYYRFKTKQNGTLPEQSDLIIETNTTYANYSSGYPDTLPTGNMIRMDGLVTRQKAIILENFGLSMIEKKGAIFMAGDKLYFKSYSTSSGYSNTNGTAGRVNIISSSEVSAVKTLNQVFMNTSYDANTKAITFGLDQTNSIMSDTREANNEPLNDTDIEQVSFKLYDDDIFVIKKNSTNDGQVMIKGNNNSLLRLACDNSSSALLKFERTGYSSNGLTFSINTNDLIRINNDGLRVISGELICNNIDTNSTTSLLLKANNANKVSLNNNDITVYENLLPNGDDVLNLGGSNNYFAGAFINSINTSTLSNSAQINMNIGGGATELSLTSSALTCSINILPSGTRNLGSSTARWNDIHYNNLVSASDRNLKENIESCILGLEFLKNVEPVSYTWKDVGKRKHIGYIAQQVEETLNKFDLNMTDWAIVGTSNDEYHLKYLEFIPILHNAILELNNKLEAYALSQDINKDIVKLNTWEDIKRRDSNYYDKYEIFDRKIEMINDTQSTIINEVNEIISEMKLECETLRNENNILKDQMEIMQNDINEFKEMKEQLKLLLNSKDQPPQQTPAKTGRLTIRQTNLTPTTTLKSEGGIKVKNSIFGTKK
jgi:hypothetical protein